MSLAVLGVFVSILIFIVPFCCSAAWLFTVFDSLWKKNFVI